MYNTKQFIEIFHLLFLNQLSQGLDKRLYALKGGCNLRFYFKSIRYSEDMDLDIQTIQTQTLQNKINRILTSVPFTQILKSYHIQIAQISQPKQTDTVQRWKIALTTPITQISLPTKIEFSRRGMGSDIDFSVVDRQLLTTYEMPPILSNHYTREAMWQHKILALAHRQQPQARDVFDLYLLLGQHSKKMGSIATDALQQAKDNAKGLTYDEYKSQVVAYLLPEYQMQFGSVDVWLKIIQDVIASLEQNHEVD
jgi:predicted nucleotidyltransferase component of viral defense system